MKPKIRYRSGYKYQLETTYCYDTGINVKECYCGEFLEIDSYGFLTIRAGYAWDGASGPTLDTKDTMRGSLVHDALYQLMRLGAIHRANRKAADKIIKRICREDGMGKFRAWYWYRTLRKCGRVNTQASSIKKVHTVGAYLF